MNAMAATANAPEEELHPDAEGVELDRPDGLSGTYQRLSEPFEITHTDIRGGVRLTYIAGEQVVSRLNEVLGAGGWSFRVMEHAINQEADEAWALGELTATIDGQHVVRQQFGSQKLKRSRSSGTPLDIGFDLKGAGTDALKKCATLIGVGLYLSRKAPAPRQALQAAVQQTMRPAAAARPTVAAKAAAAVDQCMDCGVILADVYGDDGKVRMTAADLAKRSRERFDGQTYCPVDFRKHMGVAAVPASA